MAAEGLRSLFPLQDIAVMGLDGGRAAIALHSAAPEADRRAIREQRPAVLVTIDAPSFCLRVARQVRELGIPVVHYVAPQLWAWRPERVKKLVGLIDRLMLLLPFEKEFFEHAGVPSVYVGHPVLEEADAPRAADFRARHAIAPTRRCWSSCPAAGAVWPAACCRSTARRWTGFAREHARLRVAIPVVAGTRRHCRGSRAARGPWRRFFSGIQRKSAGALAAADAALTTSGTATLELAVFGLPMVVTYKVSALSAWLARRMIQVPHVAMPNLIADRRDRAGTAAGGLYTRGGRRSGHDAAG